jgi:hypothetical protein
MFEEFAASILNRTEITMKRLDWSRQNHENDYQGPLEDLQALRPKIPKWQYQLLRSEIDEKYRPE